MNRFVFFTAAEGKVEVIVDQQPVGSASTAEGLAKILMENSISAYDELYNSSSIDFCEEEGFAAGEAGEMIDAAFEL